MLLAFAFFGLLICQSIFVWVVLDQKDRLTEIGDELRYNRIDLNTRFAQVLKQLDVVTSVADYAKDNARMAKKAAEEAQKAIDAHEAWVVQQREANARAAHDAARPRRRTQR